MPSAPLEASAAPRPHRSRSVRGGSRAAAGLIAVLLLAAGPVAAAGEGGGALVEQMQSLLDNGQFSAAIAAGQRARRMLQPGDPAIVDILDSMAWAERQQGHGELAVRYGQEAVAAATVTFGTTSIDRVVLLANLATTQRLVGRAREAEVSYREALQALDEGAPARRIVARNLAELLMETGRLAEAESEARELVDTAPPGRPDAPTLLDRGRLARILSWRGRVDEAEAIIVRARADAAGTDAETTALLDCVAAAMAIDRAKLADARVILDAVLARRLSANSAARPLAWYDSGRLELLRRDMLAAEASFRSALDLYARLDGPRSASVMMVLHALALVYLDLGLPGQAAELIDKVIVARSESLGPDSLPVAASLIESVRPLLALGKPEAALARADEALATLVRLDDPEPIRTAFAHNVRGFALGAAGQLNAAAGAFTQGTTLIAKLAGPQSADLWPGLLELAGIRLAQGRAEDAAEPLEQSVAILEHHRALTGEGLGRALTLLSRLRERQGRVAEANDAAERATAVLVDRLALGKISRSSAAFGEQRRGREIVARRLEIGLAEGVPLDASGLVEAIQLPQLTPTAATITRTAARLGRGDSALSRLLRERQDALAALQALDQASVAALARGGGAIEHASAPGRQLDLEAKLDTLDGQLRQHFPVVAELTAPGPVQLEEVKRALRPGEAVWLQLTEGTATWLAVVRWDGGVRLARSDLGAVELGRLVRRLRAQMDRRLFGDITENDPPPPFDTVAAARLYGGLIAPVADALEDVAHLAMVPDGALQSLPPALLLRREPARVPTTWADMGTLDFLIRERAISIVPSASAFVALRHDARHSAATFPFLGIGAPEFNGQTDADISPDPRALYRDGLRVDPDDLRRILTPLPEARVELLRMAWELGVAADRLPDVVLTGPQASEATVRRLPLRAHRIIALATHGIVAGEFVGLAEPALALTPPATATADDDGILTASEIATLELDADWVLLSACNTASNSGRPGAEGLSGLARAFFAAGSRTLVVSHWYVDSRSTAELTIATIRAAASGSGRAEAMRNAMMSLLDRSSLDPTSTHPYFWAPFVIVGEGG